MQHPFVFPRRPVRSFALVAAAIATFPVLANNIGENGAWGFQSVQERAVRATSVDMTEKRRGGYYDASRTTIQNNTYIERQVNCNLSASAVGNSGSNAMTASTSSPTVSNSAGTSASGSANSATSGLPLGFPAFNTAGAGVQSNTGSVSAGVHDSMTWGSTGAVSAGGGRSNQVLNSSQTSSGVQSASIQGSTACANAY